MLLRRASRTEQGAPRVNTVKNEKSVLDMDTTCGLLLSRNEVNWDSIHMDFELHKFWLISFEDRGSERLDFVKDDTQTSYYHIQSYQEKHLKWLKLRYEEQLVGTGDGVSLRKERLPVQKIQVW